MKQTSLRAYHNLNRHKINSQYGRILTLIKSSELALNDRRIAAKLSLPINVVESRLCQLCKEGLIVEDGDKYDAVTENYSRTWSCVK
jgi:predicted transcriptional regulator